MLLRRGKTFYCRVWVPLDMRELIGRNELKKSLRTDDRQTARTAAKLLTAKAEQLFFRARAGVITDRELEVLAAELIGEFTGKIAEHKTNRLDGTDWLMSREIGLFPPVDSDMVDTTLKTPRTLADVAEVVTWYTRRIEELEQEIATEFFSRSTRNWAKRIVEEKKLEVEIPPSGWFSDPEHVCPPRYDAEFDTHYEDEEEPPTLAEIDAWNSPAPPSFHAVCLTLLQAQIDAFRHELEKVQGRRNTPFQAQTAERIEAAKPRPKLTELFEAYKEHKRTTGKWSDKTLHKYTEYISDVVRAIGNRELTDYRSEDALSLIKALQRQGNSPTTITSKVEFISSLFRFALKTPERVEQWMVKGNPFAEMQVPATDADKSPKVPYSDEDLIKLLEGLLSVRKRIEPHRFWVPLVALYTGMRQSEVCQLRVSDIEAGGVPVFQIRHNPALKQMTKAKKNRTCPIHPTLIRLGFMAYVEQQRTSGHDRVFPTLTYSNGKGWTGKVRTWWNETFQKGVLADTAGKSFHSLRKSFINKFKQSGLYETYSDRSIVQSMVGHDEDDVTGEYYETDYPPKIQQRMLVKLDYGFPDELVVRLRRS